MSKYDNPLPSPDHNHPIHWASSDMMFNQWDVYTTSLVPSCLLLASLHAVCLGLSSLYDHTINALQRNDMKIIQSAIIIGITSSHVCRIITEALPPPNYAVPLVNTIISILTSLSIWGRRPIHVLHVPSDSDDPSVLYWPNYIHRLAKSSIHLTYQRNPYDIRHVTTLSKLAHQHITNAPATRNTPLYLTHRHILSPTTLPLYRDAPRRAVNRMVSSTSDFLLSINNIRSV